MVNKGGDALSCPGLDEIRSCRLESCYSWRVTEDGPCSLTDGQAGCGVGRQDRIIECLKWDEVRTISHCRATDWRLSVTID